MNRPTTRAGLVLALAWLFLSPLAHAQEATASGANTAWILTSTALVLFMTLPGLALFYGGRLTRVIGHCVSLL